MYSYIYDQVQKELEEIKKELDDIRIDLEIFSAQVNVTVELLKENSNNN